ncbi:MAG: hypothetical protein JW891_02150 [Candidatus Lokiarchaeota archaeon]|nr:hypothetical protein [Candidatus Lokiarchaeota archaeon]
MKMELTSTRNTVFIGEKLHIITKYNFEENSSILWSGIRLITKTPCVKELQIGNEEVFSFGEFEPGEYIREKSILIKNNVIPTIKKRNLEYTVQLLLRQKNPINPDDDLVIKKDIPIELKINESQVKPTKQNPISFSISGLKINVSKDAFKPGETIKINYNSENLSEIEIRLLQKANLVCYCEAYGKNCRKVEELPPAIAGDVKTKESKEGYLLLKIPEVAEPSHNYMWEPSEKEFWGLKYGDYSQWSLLVIGKKKPEFGKDIIQFEIPIIVSAKPIDTESEKEADLFSGKTEAAPGLFDGLSSKLQKIYDVSSIESDINQYIIRIKNISKNDLHGVTVKLAGLQEGLFETAPKLFGFSLWKKGEEKEIVYESKQNISAIISIIEDNAQNKIRIQSAVSADFF